MEREVWEENRLVIGRDIDLLHHIVGFGGLRRIQQTVSIVGEFCRMAGGDSVKGGEDSIGSIGGSECGQVPCAPAQLAPSDYTPRC